MEAMKPLPDVEATPYADRWRNRVRDLVLDIFRPRTKVSLREWAETHRRWPDGSPYRVSETPHVAEVLEAYSNPAIEEITIMKPTQSGLTEGLPVNAIGYHMDEDPRAILVIVPSVDEAEKWSKKKLDPMIHATPRIQGRLEDGSRKRSNTIQEKAFPGGSLGIVGSNSGRGFRMVTIGAAIGDDVEGWDATAGKGAGSEGDQVTLIRRRTDRVPDRKLVWISTPRLAGGRIDRLYHEMESRGAFHVPCPHCGEMQVLEWGGEDTPHGMKWEKRTVPNGYVPEPGEVVHGTACHLPHTAYYVCVNGCRIDEIHKPEMEAAGTYLDDEGRPVVRPGVRTVGFWLRGALTITLPGSEWPRMVDEFLKAKDNREKLRAFWNLVLGLPWEERGEAPEWERIYERREDFPKGVCVPGVEFLTVGADMQADRVEAAVWGWGRDKESWLIDYLVFDGSLRSPDTKAEMTKLLYARYPTPDGMDLPIARFALDTGYDQEAAIDWARSVADRRVMLIKGDHWKNWSVIVGTPKRSETNWKGKKHGLLLWPVGGALVKLETYGFLQLPAPLDGEPCPPGWIHLPTWMDEEQIKQLVSEDIETVTDKHGYTRREWVKNRHRNEGLDCRVYARAGAEQLGLSRLISGEDGGTDEGTTKRPGPRKPDDGHGGGGGWLDRGKGRRRRGGWL